ncbi:hypothetical protein ABQF48_12605 [Mycolicibacterium setense]
MPQPQVGDRFNQQNAAHPGIVLDECSRSVDGGSGLSGTVGRPIAGGISDGTSTLKRSAINLSKQVVSVSEALVEKLLTQLRLSAHCPHRHGAHAAGSDQFHACIH